MYAQLLYMREKGNFKRETELLRPEQNNFIRTNYIEAKIDDTQKNSKCRFCEDLRGSLNKFPDFFRMGTFIDSTRMKLLSPSK